MAQYPSRTTEYRRQVRARLYAQETPEQAERRRARERERNRRRYLAFKARTGASTQVERAELQEIEAVKAEERRQAQAAKRLARERAQADRRAYAQGQAQYARESTAELIARERAEVERIEAREREQMPQVVEPEQPAERVITIRGIEYVAVWFPHRNAQALIADRAERSSLETL
jgi:hypothetical protein